MTIMRYMYAVKQMFGEHKIMPNTNAKSIHTAYTTLIVKNHDNPESFAI